MTFQLASAAYTISHAIMAEQISDSKVNYGKENYAVCTVKQRSGRRKHAPKRHNSKFWGHETPQSGYKKATVLTHD